MEKSIIQRRKEIERELEELLDQYQCDFDLEYIKKVIYQEKDINDLNRLIATFDKNQSLDELNRIIQIINDAWNYFPHKCLKGLCPLEKFLAFQRKQDKEIIPPTADYGDDLSGDRSEFGKDFHDLSEQELINTLEKGNLSKREFDKLVEVMQSKGLSGSIMPVDPDDPETKDAIEYINYHQKLPKDYKSQKQIEKAKKALLAKRKTSLDKLKEAIMILAHSGEVKSLRILQRYANNPNSKLIIWVTMAIQECQVFLESDLLGRPMIKVSKIKK